MSVKISAKTSTKTAPRAKKTTSQEIVITRVFNAPRALVYEAWTNPVHLARWWGPRGFTNPRCDVDVRPGGLIRIDMQAPNGTIYPMSGIYLEIIQPEQLTYTAGALDEKGMQLFEMLFHVNFAEKNGKTTLTIRARVMRTTPGAEKYIGGYEAGMTQSLEKLAGSLADSVKPLVLERTFNAPVSTVWKALTDKADFQHWYFEVPDFRPEVGFEFTFTGDCDNRKYVHHCRVTEVVPGNKLAYTWRYEGFEGNSLVTFELFAEGSRQTRLKLTHEGLETFPKTPHFIRTNFEQGWNAIVGDNLKKFVENQRTSPTDYHTMNTTDTSDRELVITRVVNAPRELVWEAMTNPKHVVNWWGPIGFSSTIETMDVRVGGVWKLVMHGPDGANYPNEHIFEELVKPERIVLAHGGRREGGPCATSTKIWTFDPVEGGKTRVTIRMIFPDAAQRNFVVKEFGALEGGNQTLARLDEFLPQLQTTNKATNQKHNMTNIQPYLAFDGRCEEALEFYKKALGIKVTMLMRFKDSPDPSMCAPNMGEKVMHASFTFGDATVMASDGRCTGKMKFEGFSLSLNLPDEATAKRLFAALLDGGEVQMPLEKTFFSPCFGMVMDRFGVCWMVHVPGPMA